MINLKKTKGNELLRKVKTQLGRLYSTSWDIQNNSLGNLKETERNELLRKVQKKTVRKIILYQLVRTVKIIL